MKINLQTAVLDNDPLATAIHQIERACKKHNISFFPARLSLAEKSSCSTIDFAGSDWRDYLAFVRTLIRPVMTLHTQINGLSQAEIFSVRAPYRDRARYKRYYESVKALGIQAVRSPVFR